MLIKIHYPEYINAKMGILIWHFKVTSINTHDVLNKLWPWDADLFDSPEDVNLLVNLQLFYGVHD